MERIKKAALLTELLERMRKHESWGGETHLQKAVYFLQELFKVPSEFEFILYKHGPFSFDLRDELTSLRSIGLMDIIPQEYPYGPRLQTTDASRVLRGKFPKTLKKYDKALAYVASQLGGKGVTELERLSTALYVTRRSSSGDSVEERAAKLTSLKPHVELEDATEAVRRVDEMLADVASG